MPSGPTACPTTGVLGIGQILYSAEPGTCGTHQEKKRIWPFPHGMGVASVARRGPRADATIGPMGDREKMEPARASAPKLTYEDFLLFPDDGRRHELIDGEHFVTPSPNTRHQQVSMRLTRVFILPLENHPVGQLFAAPFDVVLSDVDVVEPDLLFIPKEQEDLLTNRHVSGAPALVIEILSPVTRKTDERTKRRLYERGGVREYWVVDPELEVIKIYHRADDGTFPRVAELTREDHATLTTPLLPGLAVPLDELFR